MSHHHHEDDKKEKKKKQREKNRRDWIFFQQVAELLEKPAPERDHKKPDKDGKPALESKPWTAKLTTIRNRLDNSKRVSEDRWNRFAGTSDGGGRGR